MKNNAPLLFLYFQIPIVFYVIKKIKLYLFYNDYKTSTYNSCSLAPIIVFVWSSCGTQREDPDETHLPDLVTTYQYR